MSRRVRGHSLLFEGAAFKRLHDGSFMRAHDGVGGTGHALCSCGVASQALDSGAARKQWHVDHRNQVWSDQVRAL